MHSEIYATLTHMLVTFEFYIVSIIFDFLEVLDQDLVDLLVLASGAFLLLVNLRLQMLLEQESEVADIDPEDELPRGHALRPRIQKTLQDYTDVELLGKTNFARQEIQTLIRFFDLPQRCYPDGFIRIESGTNTGNYYIFGPDEILIFVLIKVKSGHTNIDIVDEYFGGDHRKWSIMFHWFLEYSAPYIQSVLEFPLLEKFRPLFESFAKNIAERVSKGFYVQPAEGAPRHWVEGLEYNDPADPFRIFGFLDCSNFRTNTPRTGPSDRFEGAARFDDEYDVQRAVYSGWKKIHGVKVATIVMANGLQALYGPISARRNDIDAVNTSNLDPFLREIQNGQQFRYCVFGDGAFKALSTADSTIRSYHEAVIGAPLDVNQIHENLVMRKVRVEIEHVYGEITNLFDLTDKNNEWKHGNKHLPEKVKLLFFLYNCITCCRGNSVSLKFDCGAPSLEQYLFPQE